MSGSEAFPPEPEAFITDTAKLAFVGRKMFEIAARFGIAVEVIQGSIDTVMLHDVHDNAIEAAAIVAVGYAGVKTLDAIGNRVENFARQKQLDNRGDL